LGFDYGRWIQMITLPLSLLAITALAAGTARMRRDVPNWAILAYLGTVSLPHAHARLEFFALGLWPCLFILVAIGFFRARFLGKVDVD